MNRPIQTDPRSRAARGLVKKIVELHGSAVQAASVVGQGSSFWFTLPAAS